MNETTTTTTTPIVLNTTNCSTSNPCGSNGYCRIEDENIMCDCKFWWTGTYCDQWTSSGKQVIILSALVGLLIIGFYGALLIRCIKEKCKSTNTNKTETTSNSKIKHTCRSSISFGSKMSEQRIFAILIGIATVLMGVGALAGKWILLKPIHDELVEQYQSIRILKGKRPAMCNKMNFGTDFKLVTFPVSVALILIFAVLSKRTAVRHRHLCRGYVTVPMPLDFFAHFKRTFSAVIFALYADELLDIANELMNGSNTEKDRGIMIVYLMQIFKVILIGFRCYPTLVAVYLENILALFLASLYAWLDFGVTIYYGSVCRNTYYPLLEPHTSDITAEQRLERYFKYYGTGTKLLFLQLLVDTPRYLCLAYVSIKLPMLFIKRIRYRKRKTLFSTREQRMLLNASSVDSVETRYVKNLFGYTDSNGSHHRFFNYFRWLYNWRNDFRFSARVLSVYASIFLVLYFVNLQAIIRFIPKLEELRPSLEEMIFNGLQTLNLVLPILTGNSADELIRVRVPHFVGPFLIGMILSTILTVAQLLFMLASIRRNLLQAFRGDDSEIPRRIASDNTMYAAGNFHFGGYLIGFLLWGYIVVLAFAMLISVLIDLWITYGNLRIIETLIKAALPAILFVLFKMYLNKFLAQYIFLQGCGAYLSINNRRIFMVFIYFNFFLDAFLGLVASITRVIKSAIAGLLYMCRLDYSPLGRKLETFDVGFSAYCGFIHMECAHRHPIMLCFASHLLRQHLEEKEGIRSKLSRAKRRWHLAVFLIINPTFVYRRKAFLEQFRVHETRIRLDDQHNITTFYVEQSTPGPRRFSIISDIDLKDLWQRQKF